MEIARAGTNTATLILETLFRALALGRIRTAPLQSLIAVLVLFLGVTSAMVLSVVNAAVLASVDRGIERYSPDVTVQVLGRGLRISDRILDDVRALPGVANAQPVIEGAVTIDGRRLRIEGIDFFAHAFADDPSLRRNLLPGLYAPSGTIVSSDDLFDGNVIVISRPVSEAIGKRAGETLAASLAGKAVTFTIGGVLDETTHEREPNLAFIDIGAAQRLFARGGSIDRIDIVSAPDAAPALVAALSRVLPTSVQPVLAADRFAARTTALRRLRAALQTIAVVILVLAWCIIAATASSAVVERLGDTAILTAIGATRRSLLTTFFFEGVLYGIVGAVGGGIAGALTAPWLVTTILLPPPKTHDVDLVSPTAYVNGIEGVTIVLACTLLATAAAFIPASWTLAARTGARRGDGRRLRGGTALAAGAALVLIGVFVRVPMLATACILIGAALGVAPLLARLAEGLLAQPALPRPAGWLAATFSREPRPAAIVPIVTLAIAVAVFGAATIVETTLDAPIGSVATIVRGAFAIALAIAIAGLMSGMLANTLNRRDAIATLRNIGASRAHIVQSIFLEALISAVVGSAIGLLAALALAFIALDRGPMHVPFVTLACVLFGIALASIAAALPAALVAGRIRTDLRRSA